MPSSRLLPCPAPGSEEQREAPRKAGPGWAWRGGLPGRQEVCQEVCRRHSPIPVTSAAVAFKRAVQIMRSDRGVWVAVEPWAHGRELGE